MATLTTAVNTAFTPDAGQFIIQVGGSPAPVTLLRRNTAGAPWVPVGPVLSGAWIVDNPIAGADYQFRVDGTAVVQADQ